MLALLGALGEEIWDLRRQMVLEESIGQRGWRVFKGKYRQKDTLLVQTGMGRARVATATARIVERYPITCLVSLGFAGALTEELRVADILLCRELRCGSRGEAAAACYSDDRLLRLARQTSAGQMARIIVGSSVTVGAMLAEPEQKRALGKAFGAHAVDMESYWVARMAATRGIPFLAVRATSDTLAQRLPPLDRFFGADGEWLWQKAARHFLAHPAALAQMPGVYWNARRARKSLTNFTTGLMSRLCELR